MQDSCCLFKEKECYLLVNTTDMITFSNAKINIGSRIRFVKQPISNPTMLELGLPSARIKAENDV